MIKFVKDSIGGFAISVDKIMNVLVGMEPTMFSGEYYGYPVKIIDTANENVTFGVYESYEKAKMVMEDVMLFCVQEYEEYEQRILAFPPSSRRVESKETEVAK